MIKKVKDQFGMSITGTGELKREIKNYSKETEELLRKKFEDYTFERENLLFTITKISNMKGHAEINIRKGKEIVIYEYEIEGNFRAESDSDDCEGTFKLIEINESDLDFRV